MSFGERSRPFWAAPLTKRYGMQKPLAREAVKAGEAAREAGRLEGFARRWQRDDWGWRLGWCVCHLSEPHTSAG
jgi:hypothetical protein